MADNFIQTYTGKRVDPMHMRPDDVCIADIAHALALTNRFTGHTTSPYSVAQHSCLVADLCPRPWKLWGLLHDAPEAYLADISRPVKIGLRSIVGNALDDIDSSIMNAVCKKFGLSKEEPPAVKKADDDAIANEAFSFFGKTEAYKHWHHQFENGYKRLGYLIEPVGWEEAEVMFFSEFNRLCENKEEQYDLATQFDAVGDRHRRDMSTKTAIKLPGVGTDAPTAVSANGGKQSHVPYRCDLLPASAALRVSAILEEGAKKYGDNNWRKLELSDHVNHAMTHVLAHLAGDRQDDHLGHAACRMLFALETALTKGEK